MPTYANKGRVTSGALEAGYKSFPRVLDFIVNLASIDGGTVVMTTATDDIQLATLPGNAHVIGGSIQQLAVGTGTGTLVLRVGTTAITGTLASTAAVGTVASSLAAAIPLAVPAAGAELNLLGATAARTDGKVRVTLVVVEGDRSPREPTVAQRDATL